MGNLFLELALLTHLLLLPQPIKQTKVFLISSLLVSSPRDFSLILRISILNFYYGYVVNHYLLESKDVTTMVIVTSSKEKYDSANKALFHFSWISFICHFSSLFRLQLEDNETNNGALMENTWPITERGGKILLLAEFSSDCLNCP